MSLGRIHLSYANVVSTLCLFLLLGGVAYAAVQLPKNSVGAKQLKRNAVTGPKIKNGAISAAKLQKSALGELRGPAGPQGAAGPVGQAGPAGPPGPAGGPLPADVTLRGSVRLGNGTGSTVNNLFATTAVGFGGYILRERPVVNLVLPPFAKIPAPPACPGTVSAPEAAPGNLCIYLVTISPNSGGSVTITDPGTDTPQLQFNVDTKAIALVGDGRAGRVGFGITHSVPVTSGILTAGTWAVTG